MQQQQQAYTRNSSNSPGNLMQTAEGKGPSVAGLQLGQGSSSRSSAAVSSEQAAGATGQGGVLARYAAMNNAGHGRRGREPARLRLARAAEVAHAQQALGGVLNNELEHRGEHLRNANQRPECCIQANAIAAKKNDEDFRDQAVGLWH